MTDKMGPSMFPILQTDEVLLGMLFFHLSPSLGHHWHAVFYRYDSSGVHDISFVGLKLIEFKKKINQILPPPSSAAGISVQDQGGVLLIFLLICISGIMLVSSSKWSESPTEPYSRFSESHREISFPSIIPWWRARVEPPLCNWKMTLK